MKNDSDSCGHCGAELPPGARSCKHCGSSDTDGWADEADEGSLDDDFDYDEFVEGEFSDRVTTKLHPFWKAVALMLVLLFVLAMIQSVRI